MALIENSKGRTDRNSGYTRIFGNEELGQLFSRVQAAVISAGTELEKIIASYANTSLELDDILSGNFREGVYLITKDKVKQSKLTYNFEADLLVFEIENRRQHCYIIELKDGDNFDTKKSSGEKDNMLKFQSHIASKVQFTTSIHFCCFNQDDKAQIVHGFKGRITTEEAMTGRELCAVLKLDYAALSAIRARDQKQNFDYFLKSFLSIEEVKKRLNPRQEYSLF